MPNTSHPTDTPDNLPTREGVERARDALRAGRLEAVAHLLDEAPEAIAALDTTPTTPTMDHADD